jgi:glycosyltransferase involved in cell wall biosynthesis
MKIAYVTLYDATDIRNWSGLDLHIWKSLEAAGAEIELIGNLHHGRSVRRKLRRFWGERFERRSFLIPWDVDTARDYAADAANRLSSIEADVVLSPSPIPLAFLKSAQPRILWTDATFAGLASFYPEFTAENVCGATTRSGHAIDRHVLKNCELAIYSSEWAAETAREAEPRYASKVRVIPFGANVEVHHSRSDVAALARARGEAPVRLLFIGVDWKRKGGDHAVAVAAELNRRGVRTELIVVGAQPEIDLASHPFVKPLGFVSKADQLGREKVNQLLSTSHFLILPSRAECCAVVLAEACAYGLPIVATRVGGMGTVVEDEVNGRLFNSTDSPEAWAAWIEWNLRASGRYAELSAAAFAQFERRLNWDAAGRSAVIEISQMLQCRNRRAAEVLR